MQLRWIAIGIVCFSAPLLSACGNAAGDRLSGRSASAAMSTSTSRYGSSDKDEAAKDECDDWENYDESNSASSSKDADHECEEPYHLGPWSWDSRWSSSSQDEDETCKVTLCHVPPASNCTPHMIRVGMAVVQALIEHGDYPGACDPVTPPPQCLPDLSVCKVDADCCTGSICLPDPVQGTACGVPG